MNTINESENAEIRNRLLGYLNLLQRPVEIYEIKDKLKISNEVIKDSISDCFIGLLYEGYNDFYQARRYEVFMDILAFKEFIKTEIETFLEDENQSLSISDIEKQCYRSLCNYFNYSQYDLYHDGEGGIRVFGNLTKIIEVINENPQIFYKIVFTKTGSWADRVGLIKWVNQVIPSNYSRFEYSILYNFRKSKRESFELKNLDFRINRSPVELDVPKPISMDYVISQIEKSSDIYSYDKETEKVFLKTDLERIKKILQSNSHEFLKFNDFVQSSGTRSSGILSFTYTGPNFPLIEAGEYVKLRNIIFISKAYSLATDFKKLFDFNKITDSKILSILSAIIGEENLEKWITENIKISFYEEYFEPTDKELIDLEKRIIEDISPLLNLEGNPGNLFRITLEDKLNAYLEGKSSKDESK